MAYPIIPTYVNLTPMKEVREKSLNPLITQHNQHSTKLDELEQGKADAGHNHDDDFALKADKSELESGMQKVHIRCFSADMAFKTASVSADKVEHLMQFKLENGNVRITLPTIVAYDSQTITNTQIREGTAVEFINRSRSRHIHLIASSSQDIHDGTEVISTATGEVESITRLVAAKNDTGTLCWYKLPTLPLHGKIAYSVNGQTGNVTITTASLGAVAATVYNAFVAANADNLANKVDDIAGKGLSSEDFTTAHKTKLDNLESPLAKGRFDTLADLQAAHPTPEAGATAWVTTGSTSQMYAVIGGVWVASPITGTMTPAEIKQCFLANENAEFFDTATLQKVLANEKYLADIVTGAQHISPRALGYQNEIYATNPLTRNLGPITLLKIDGLVGAATLPEIVAYNTAEMTTAQCREGSYFQVVNLSVAQQATVNTSASQKIKLNVNDPSVTSHTINFDRMHTYVAIKDSTSFAWFLLKDEPVGITDSLLHSTISRIDTLDQLLTNYRGTNTIQFQAKELVIYANKGDLESQGALDTSSNVANCFVDKVDTEMFGRIVPTFRIYDKGTALAQLLIPAVESDFTNLMAYGGYYTLKMKLDETDYGGLFVGVQSVAQGKRYGTMLSSNADNIQLSSPDTNGMVTQITTHPRREAFTTELQIPAGMTPSDIYFNGEQLAGSQVAWVTNSGGNDDVGVLLSSGSSSSTSRISYLSEGGLVVYEQDTTVQLTRQDFENFKGVTLITPIGRADIQYVIPTDMPGRFVGDEITVVCKNIGGTVSFINADPANPTTLINKETAFMLEIKGVTVIRMYNTLENGNVYEVSVDSFTFLGDRYATLLDLPILVGRDVDDGTGAKLQVTGDISVNGSLLTSS